MATSGYTDVKATSSNTLRFNWWQISQSRENNSTKIGWSLQLFSTATGTIYSSVDKNYSVTIEGKTTSGVDRININASTSKTLASGEQDITHNADGTKTFSYSFSQYFGVDWGGTTIGTISGSGTGTLEPLTRGAYITSAPDLEDTDTSAYIEFYNPYGENSILEACISFTGANDDIPYRRVLEGATGYIFEFTPEELETLQNGVTSGYERDIYYYLKTTVGTETYWNSVKRTYTLTSAMPSISIDIFDINDITSELTGDPAHRFIRGYSDLSYTVHAQAEKGATITGIRVESGSYLNTAEVGLIPKVDLNNCFLVATATDSRGNTVSTTADFTYVATDYTYPWCHPDLATLTTASGGIYFDVYGTYYQGWFDGILNGSGGGQRNEVTIQYRYKLQNEEEYGAWIDVDISDMSFDDEMFTQKIAITGLDYNSSYMVQTRAIDKLDRIGINNYLYEIPIRMIPVFDWSREDFAVNVPMNVKNGILVPSYANDFNEYGDFIEAVGTAVETYGGEGGISIGSGTIGTEYHTEIHGNDIRVSANENLYLSSTYGDIYFDALGMYPLKDYVIAQGDDGSYAYRKWASGKMEAWRTSTSAVTARINITHGALYYADNLALNTSEAASQFKTVESVNLTLNKNYSSGIFIPVVKSVEAYLGRVTIEYLVGGGVSTTTASFIPNVYIIGTWK